MKTAVIYVFSGTGNTLITADMLKRHLASSGIKVNVHNIKTGEPYPLPDAFDYVGFAYPVYAYNIPEIFFRFVKSLPCASGKTAFILKTSGEPFSMNSVSSYLLIKLLRGKGFDVALEQHLLMPYNILFRYPDSLVKQMYLYSDALCAVLAKALVAGERSDFRFNPLRVFASIIFRIQWPGARLNGRLYSVNMKKCVKCMRCVKDCPERNISFKGGRFRFSGRCVMCMRCAMLCPADAVNVGLVRFFKVSGAYEFNRLLRDACVPADFINPNTKGYFRLFRTFFRNADITLSKHSIKVPVVYEADNNERCYDSGSDVWQ